MHLRHLIFFLRLPIILFLYLATFFHTHSIQWLSVELFSFSSTCFLLPHIAHDQSHFYFDSDCVRAWLLHLNDIEIEKKVVIRK